MNTALLALNSPVRPVTSFSFLRHSAILNPVAPRQETPAPAIDTQEIDAEERRWQLEWERRNIED
jgi:hypothetical protein